MYLPRTYGLAGESSDYLDSLFRMPHYYPVVSDLELKYPFRVRSPLALAGFPLTYRRPARRFPPWYSSLSPALRREPWWYEMPILRDPFGSRHSALRQSFLSPIKRTFVWSSKPLRSVIRW